MPDANIRLDLRKEIAVRWTCVPLLMISFLVVGLSGPTVTLAEEENEGQEVTRAAYGKARKELNESHQQELEELRERHKAEKEELRRRHGRERKALKERWGIGADEDDGKEGEEKGRDKGEDGSDHEDDEKRGKGKAKKESKAKGKGKKE